MPQAKNLKLTGLVYRKDVGGCALIVQVKPQRSRWLIRNL